MSIASTIALSGMNAASLRLQAVASNVANARLEIDSTDSAKVTPAPSAPGALQVNQIDVIGGGTSAILTSTSRAAAQVFDQNLSLNDDDAWNFRANPYVALTNQMVQTLVTRFDLVANAHVIHTDTQMSAALLDVKA